MAGDHLHELWRYQQRPVPFTHLMTFVSYPGIPEFQPALARHVSAENLGRTVFTLRMALFTRRNFKQVLDSLETTFVHDANMEEENKAHVFSRCIPNSNPSQAESVFSIPKEDTSA
jgi:hypothetical protein